MARRKNQSPLEDLIDNVFGPIAGILVLAIVGYVFTHPRESTIYDDARSRARGCDRILVVEEEAQPRLA